MPRDHHSKSVPLLFEAAQQGDRQALDQFLTQVRPQILATCYRLIGTVDDADDATQEAMIAILEGIDPVAPSSTWRPLVYSNAVAASLQAIANRELERAETNHSARANTASPPRAIQVEPLLTGAMPLQEIEDLERHAGRPLSTRESLALVFVHLLQLLPPEMRAVYLMTDMLGCAQDAVERATRLGAPQVVEHLAFARRVMDAARAKLPSQLMPLSHPIAGKVLRRLGRCLIAQDAARAVSLFDLDAILVLPAIGSFTGHEAIAAQFARMFQVGLAPQKTALIEINAQPALVFYQVREERGAVRYYANLVLAASISEAAPNANKIVRVDVVTDGRMVQKIGAAAKQDRTKA